VWSPDGSSLAFVRLGFGADSLVTSVLAYLVDADGSNERQLAALPLSEIGIRYVPAWPPDGLHLAYSGRGGTYFVDADGSGFRMVSAAPAYVPAQWAP
jgi:Tol biopolymer transport system component